jgi:flagellar protein FlaI
VATEPPQRKKKTEDETKDGQTLSSMIRKPDAVEPTQKSDLEARDGPRTKDVSAGRAVTAPKRAVPSRWVKAGSGSGSSQLEELPRAPMPPSSPLSTDTEAKEILRGIAKPGKVDAEKKLMKARELKQEAKDAQRRAKRDRKLMQELAKHSEYSRRVSERLGLDPNRPITDIPALPGPTFKQVEYITVQEERAFIRVSFDETTNRYLYETIEPVLTPTEVEFLELIRDTMVRTLESRNRQEDEEAEAYLVKAMEQAILDHSIVVDQVSKHRLQYYLLRDFVGYGPIDVIMRDPMIEDISCDGPEIPIYLFHRTYESIKTNVSFKDELELDSFVIRLAQRCGKQISIAEPLLDATLPDKSRLQCSLSKEVTTRGSSFTIRKFRSDPLTPTDMCRLGTFNPELAAFFWFAMEEGVSVIYAGGTASGKTSTLNAISTFIPPQKKIVSIEDTREINLPHENWIAGLTRAGFGGEIVGGKIAGTIDMYKLLEAALRQRPEYLLVGEVRGPEAQTLFQAMATGHSTYSTLHADSVQSAVYRLENPPISVPRIMLQTLGAMAVQVQARVNHRLVRRIKEVVEIVGIDPETKDLLTNKVFEWESAKDEYLYLGKSVVLERIMEKRNWSEEKIEEEWTNRTMILEWMVEKGIRKINDVVNVVSAYYSTPTDLMARVRDQMQNKSGPMVGGHPRA